jgi:hypothetical protein
MSANIIAHRPHDRCHVPPAILLSRRYLLSWHSYQLDLEGIKVMKNIKPANLCRLSPLELLASMERRSARHKLGAADIKRRLEESYRVSCLACRPAPTKNALKANPILTCDFGARRKTLWLTHGEGSLSMSTRSSLAHGDSRLTATRFTSKRFSMIKLARRQQCVSQACERTLRRRCCPLAMISKSNTALQIHMRTVANGKRTIQYQTTRRQLTTSGKACLGSAPSLPVKSVNGMPRKRLSAGLSERVEKSKPESKLRSN